MTYGQVVSKGTRVADDDVAKGMFRQGVVPTIARVNPNRSMKRVVTGDPQGRRIIGKADLEDVEKFGGIKPLGAALKQPKALFGGIRSGFSAGRAGSTQIASSTNAGTRVGTTMGMAMGRNPGKTALAAGGVGGAAGMGLYGNRKQQRQPQPMMAPMGMYGGFGKRSYDPEGERRYRQGAAAAATGIAGAELARRGARDIRSTSRATRALRDVPQVKAGNPPKAPKTGANGRPLAGAAADAANLGHADRMANFHRMGEMEQAQGKFKNLPKRLLVVTPKSGAKVVGGAGLGAVSLGLLRNRHQERWD